MTVNTSAFTDWPRTPGTAGLKKFNRASTNLRLILAYLLLKWGGADLGCYGVRDIRGGTTISTHSFGAAQDWSYRGLGSTVEERRAAVASIIQWLIDHSAELGIQAIHDYLNCRIWHSVRAGGAGWKPQAASTTTGMGQTWGDWLHIETFEAAWAWDTPIDQRLDDTSVVPSSRPTIGYGSTGQLVAAAQTIIRERASQDIGNSDGQFGRRTLAGWRNVVAYVHATNPATITVDDDIDGIDWNVLAWIDLGWERLYAAGFPQAA